MQTLRLLFPIFCFLLLLPILHCASEPAYVPNVNIAVDCGLTGLRDALDGRKWVGDVSSEFSPSESTNGNKSIIAVAPGNGVNDILYSTARVSRSPFTYTFPVTPGPKFIRLYFLPETYGEFAKFDAFFTVKTGQFTILKNFSAALVAYSSGEIIVFREFCIHVGESSKLDLAFIPSNNSYAFVNAIEVVSMPSNLYYTPAEEQGTTGTHSVVIRNNTALELYHRLNMGGDEVEASQDSGMYRTWTVNEWYISTFVIKTVNYSSPINYTVSTPNYTATDKVYQSAIFMGKNQTFNTLRNLTVDLPVHVGFNYLVRLHFCQFQTFLYQLEENRKSFTVYINKRKIDSVDLVSVDSPVYKDYVVLMVGENTSNISIELHPLPSVSFDAMLNGIEVFKLSNGSSLAVPNPVGPPSPPADGKALAKKSDATVIIAAVSSCVGFAILFSLVGFVVLWKMSKKKKKKKKRTKRKGEGSLLPEQRCRCFSFDEILEATNYFNKKREIGVGGFGAVYKGIFEDEDLTVAIKRLNPESSQGEQEFKTEIELLSDLRHFNLVSLIGYCIEGKEMMLVYEFMQNGTFRDHLYDTTHPLPWKKRLEICYGAARGLNYLHSGVENAIIHRDVKTTNILLDENFVAKVSDFGMSKMGPMDTAMNTAVKGTWAYLDPEYFRRFQVTVKSDVYSFGVVLFEVLCGRPPLDPTAGEEKFKLTIWAKRCIEKGTVHQIIDPNLKGKISPECLQQYLELAMSCISDQMKNRPSMAVVEEKLRFLIKLQEEEDAIEMKNHPDGDFSYPEEPLSPLASMSTSLRSESIKSHIATMLSGSDFTASTMMSGDLIGSMGTSSNAGPHSDKS